MTLRHFLHFSLILFITGIPFFTNAQFAGPKDGLIVVGKVDTIFSTTLKEKRAIWISVPQSGQVPGKKFPVVYLLDGDAHFYSMMGTIHQLSSVNGNAICPEMILVGIPNTDRMGDLTPTHVLETFGDTTGLETTGGLDLFTTFLEKELMPYIEANYPVTTYKTYIGHSLGGLSVMYTYLKRPDLFNNYLAIDPSLWWDHRLISTMIDSLIHPTKFDRTSMYVAMANTLPEGMTMYEAARDTTEETEHFRAILKFCNDVEMRKNQSGRRFKWKYYEQEDHSSVPMRAEFDALRFLFSWYTLDRKKLDAYMKPGSTATVQEFENLITGHYTNVSDQFGYKVLPEEPMINSLGYQFLSSKRTDLSYACFDMNIKNYPQSANVYDSMGDYYVEQGDKDMAIKFFSKALEIEELSYSREKLDALKKK